MPLLMAFFVSLVLLPFYRFLIKIKIPEVIAIVLSILAAALVIIGILTFFFVAGSQPGKRFSRIGEKS